MKPKLVGTLFVITLLFSCNFENTSKDVTHNVSVTTKYTNEYVCYDSFCVFFYLPKGFVYDNRDTSYYDNLLPYVTDTFSFKDSSIGITVIFSEPFEYDSHDSLSQELKDMFHAIIIPVEGDIYTGYLDTINMFPYIHMCIVRQRTNSRRDLIFSYYMKICFSIEIFNSLYFSSDTIFYKKIMDSVLNSIIIKRRGNE